MDLINEVISENPNQVAQYDPENPRLLEYFVGQIMKKSKGKANPASARTMMKEQLDKLAK